MGTKMSETLTDTALLLELARRQLSSVHGRLASDDGAEAGAIADVLAILNDVQDRADAVLA
jgi:hypothetical protein